MFYITVSESIYKSIDKSLNAVVILIFWSITHYITISVKFPSIGPGLSVQWAGYCAEFRQNPLACWRKDNTGGMYFGIYLQPSL